MKNLRRIILISIVFFISSYGISQSGPFTINNSTSYEMKCLLYLSHCGVTIDNSITVAVGPDSQLIVPPLVSTDPDLKWFAVMISLTDYRSGYRRRDHNPIHNYLPPVFSPNYNPTPYQIHWIGNNEIEVY